MKTKIAVSILIASIFASTPLLAGEGGPDSHDGSRSGVRGPTGGMGMHEKVDPERMVRHISGFLELDESTTQELTNVALAAQPQLLALREKSRANRAAIMAIDGSADDYSVTLHELAAESGQIATEMTLLLTQLRVDIHSKLTEEQQQKLAERMQHRREGKRRAPGADLEQ